MRVYEAFETSEKLVNEGRLCEIEFGGQVIAKVWIRPADPGLNADYRRELAELSVGLVQAGQNVAEIDPDLDRELLWKVYARTVILRWEWTDQKDRKDPKLKFSEENALKLFRRVPKFFEGIQRAARQWTEFRAAHEKEAAGN